MSTQSLTTTQSVLAGQFSTLGFFLWPNSTRWKEGKKGGKKKLSPQNSLTEAQDLTEEDGCVLWTFRLSFK